MNGLVMTFRSYYDLGKNQQQLAEERRPNKVWIRVSRLEELLEMPTDSEKNKYKKMPIRFKIIDSIIL